MGIETGEGQLNPYKLTTEQLTMPEGGSHKENLIWVDQLAEIQLEGIQNGFSPQIPFMHPRYMKRWNKVLKEYQKGKILPLDGPSDGHSKPGRISHHLRFASSD